MGKHDDSPTICFRLGYQVEHHLYPDMPSSRYSEIAPKVKDICERYGLSYVTGSLPRQVASAWWTIIRLSLPNDFAAKLERKPQNVTDLVQRQVQPKAA